MQKILNALLHYLKDWKNILTHSLIGVGILAVAAFLPVPWYFRIAILAAVITGNIMRMRIERSHRATVAVRADDATKK